MLIDVGDLAGCWNFPRAYSIRSTGALPRPLAVCIDADRNVLVVVGSKLAVTPTQFGLNNRAHKRWDVGQIDHHASKLNRIRSRLALVTGGCCCA